MNHVEDIILRNLQYSEDYTRKVLPYLKEEYFATQEEKNYFNCVKDHFDKYNALPSKDALNIKFQKLKVAEEVFNNLTNLATEYEKGSTNVEAMDWLLDTTEQFCKDKALFNALTEAINIAQGENTDKSQLSKTAIPELMSSALAVSFDTNIGHDYIENADLRYDFYHRKVHKIETHLQMLNKITNGGAERKTVNCIAAGTGVGKSMLLCDLAAGYAKAGHNVLYITNEMAEEKISQRVDANLMNIDIAQVEDMDKAQWDLRIKRVTDLMTGKIIVKEYPTSTAHVGHYRFLLKELKQKQNFIPDILIIDYLNICASAKHTDKSNSYTYIKSICEELRGLAVETNTVLWTATQLNRDGIDSSDVDLKNISESMGGPMTFDFLIALISNEDLANLGQVMIKQLKNRYSDLFQHNKFTIGVDRGKMKFFDLNNSTTNIQQATTAPKKQTNVKKGNFSGIKT